MKKIIFTLLFAFLIIFKLASINPPTFKFTPDTLDGGGIINVDMFYDNSDESYMYGEISIFGPNSYFWKYEDFSSNSTTDKKYSFQLTVDKYDAPGLYKIHSIQLPHIGQTILIKGATFLVKNTFADTVAPKVTNFKVSKNKAVPGDTVIISFVLNDSLSGISKTVGFQISDTFGHVYFDRSQDNTFSNIKKASLSYKYVIGKYETNGPRLLTLNVSDLKGNDSTYHSKDLNFKLSISGAKADTIPPVLKSANCFIKNDSIFLTIIIHDNLSGLKSIDYGYLNNSNGLGNGYYFSKSNEVIKDSICTVNLSAVNKYIATGKYSLYLNFSDNAGNSNYNTDTVSITNKYSDSEPPKIVSVKFDKDTVIGRGFINLIIRVTDNKSGVQNINGMVQDSATQKIVSFYTNFKTPEIKDTIIILKIGLSEFGPSGKWFLKDIEIRDFANLNYSQSINLPGFYYYSKYLDITPPTFESIQFVPKSVNAGDTETIIIKAKDNLSGINNISYYDDVTQNSDILNWSMNNGTYTLKIPINKFTAAMSVNYQLNNISDVAGNINNINESGIGYTIVNNGKSDNIPPIFDSLKISPVIGGITDTIKLRFFIHDDLSGTVPNSVVAMFSPVMISLKEDIPHGATLLLQYVNKNEFDYKIVPGKFLPGKYYFEFINMTDSAGNQHNFTDIDYFDKGIYFEIPGIAKVDTIAPVLLSLKISPETAKPGDNVTFEAKVLEKESSLLIVYSQIKNLEGIDAFDLQPDDWKITQNKDTFVCKSVFKIPERASNGTWQFEIFEVLDNYFNFLYLTYGQDTMMASFKVTGGQTYSNRPPTWIIKNINLTMDAETKLNYKIPNYLVSDIDENPLTFSAVLEDGSILPSWISFSPAQFNLTFNPTNLNRGDNIVYIIASDPNGLKDTLKINIHVDQVNHGSVGSIQGLEIKLYPNPATEIITLESPYLLKSIELYDLNGRVVFKEIGNKNSINVSGINKGIYILKAETEKMTYVEKVIIK